MPRQLLGHWPKVTDHTPCRDLQKSSFSHPRRDNLRKLGQKIVTLGMRNDDPGTPTGEADDQRHAGNQHPQNCAELWDSQLKTFRTVRNTGMVVTTDITLLPTKAMFGLMRPSSVGPWLE